MRSSPWDARFLKGFGLAQASWNSWFVASVTGQRSSNPRSGCGTALTSAHQKGSLENSTDNLPDFAGGTLLIQARTTLPFTSISQAPQLPPMQPVGMLTPAAVAAISQSVPTVSVVLRPLGQCTEMVDISAATV